MEWNDKASQWTVKQNPGDDAQGDPALTSLDGTKLLCVYVKSGTGNGLYFKTWNGETGWSLPASCGETTWGCPALYTVTDNGVSQIYCIFAANNYKRDLISLIYDPAANTWSRAPSGLQESTNFGVKGTSYNGDAYISFQKNNAKDVLVSTFSKGQWLGNQEVGETSADPPTVCAYNGVLNCFFASNNQKRDLLWSQRPLLNIEISSWMAKVADDTLLSNMSIPGTHDSAAINTGIPFATTQTMSIPQQLASGVRYLDLRCKEEGGVLKMYHGPIDLGATLIQILEMLDKFLKSNSSEAIITQVTDEASSSNFVSAFQSTPAADNGRFDKIFVLGTTTPKLGDVGGRIQLVRRFPSPDWSAGIDVSKGWQNNNPNFTIVLPGGLTLTIQDEYEPPALSLGSLVDRKQDVSQNMLSMAKADADPNHWYINFMSGVSFNIGLIASPALVALGTFFYLWSQH